MVASCHTVGIDNKQMNDMLGPKINFNAVHGSFVLRREITEAERDKREAQAEVQRQDEEAQKREEAAAAAAAAKQRQEEEAVRRK
jgi:hypothetical protein